MSRGLHFEFIYKHSPQRVWRALTDSAAIARWLMPNDFQPVVGHKFQLRTKPRPGFDGIVKCEVLEMDAPRRLSYSWKGGGNAASFRSNRLPWAARPAGEQGAGKRMEIQNPCQKFAGGAGIRG
jgi:uncharacterized protein YndB with AHSA1/START domain